MRSMTIRLGHTIVPTKNKIAAAQFFAEIFGLTVKPGDGYFAQVQVNGSLTLDFADEPDLWRTSHHYAFHVSDAGVRGHLEPGEGAAACLRKRAVRAHQWPDLHPARWSRLLLRGPGRAPAGSHDGAGDGDLAASHLNNVS
jgi:hypothetical protein